MKSIGIVAEYNPFHLGHAYQLSYLAEEWPEAVRIVVMSGSFVQRGMPAFFSKFHRAYWAVLGGADLVIELPTAFALRSAEFFATGSMRLLDKLGVDAFSFGSEVTNVDLLCHLAELSNSSLVQEECKQLMKEGKSYGEALRQALISASLKAKVLLDSPNALLGLEYIRALQNYHLSPLPLLIERKSAYHSKNLGDTLPSSTAIREVLPSKNWTILQSCFPEEIFSEVKITLEQGAYLDTHRYEDFLLYESRKATAEQLQNLGDFKEGIENRWLQAAQEGTWSQARKAIKSKRYSYARLDRMAAYVALNATKAFLSKAHEEGPQYGRILAFNNMGRKWLKENTSTLPLITKWSTYYKQATGLAKEMAALDMRATDTQALCMSASMQRQGEKDFKTSPITVN